MRENFTPTEVQTLHDCIDLGIKSYKRTQNTRPEFQEIATRIIKELEALKSKTMQLIQADLTAPTKK